jgi:DmsE family decaheme c-type cytochrome
MGWKSGIARDALIVAAAEARSSGAIRAAAAKTTKVVAVVARLIVGGALVVAQPTLAEPTAAAAAASAPAAAAGSDYSAFMNFVQSGVASPTVGSDDSDATLKSFIRVADAAPAGDGPAPNDVLRAAVAGKAKGDDYTVLSDFVRVADAAPAVDGPAPNDAVHVGLAGKANGDDYTVLSDFVRVADASPAVDGPAPNDAVHAGMAKGDDYKVLSDFVSADNASGAAPDDAIHAGVRGSAAATGDADAVLRNFARDADGAGAAPDDAVHARLRSAARTVDDFAALRDYVATPTEEAKPTIVAAATVKPPPAKKVEASDDAPATYIGSEACVKCHRDQVATFGQTLHGEIFLKHPRGDQEKLGCEACHGPGSKHAKTKETDGGAPGDIIAFGKDSPRPVEERNAICLSCHERADRTYWKGSAHETQGLACTSCHQLMEKVSVKNQMVKSTEVEVCFQCHKDRMAQFDRPVHHPLREGDMTCSSCHNPHGSATDSLLRGASINETCYKCHADKRGPFLWEHEPVRESCLNCHEPHGTVNEYLLKVQRPRLCQLCHEGGPGHGNPGNPMVVQALNRSCQNCHTKVHGSNSPAGSLFQR